MPERWRYKEYQNAWCVYHDSDEDFAVVICQVDSDAILIADYLNAADAKPRQCFLSKTVWM